MTHTKLFHLRNQMHFFQRIYKMKKKMLKTCIRWWIISFYCHYASLWEKKKNRISIKL